MTKTHSLLLLTGATLVLPLATSQAQWLANPPNANPANNYADTANWTNGVINGIYGDSSVNQIVVVGQRFESLTFNGTNTAYTLFANGTGTGVGNFAFGNGGGLTVTNTVTASQIINPNLAQVGRTGLGTVFLSSSAANGSTLTLNGNYAGGGSVAGLSQQVRLAGTGGNVIVNGVVSDGTGGGSLVVQKTGGAASNSTFTLNGANTYSGATETSNGSGTLILGNKSALGTGQIRNIQGTAFQSNTALTGANAIANTINYVSSQGTNTTSNASLTFAAGSNTATLVSGTAPAVGDLVTNGGSGVNYLPFYTRVTAVNGTTVTFSNNAVVAGTSPATVATAPATGGTGGTMFIGGATDLEFSGTQNLTTAFSTGAASTQTYSVTNTGRTIFSGVMQEQNGAASILKTGTGTLALSGANTFTGTTTVTAGALLLNNTTGSGTGVGAVTVAAGATLGGTGTIGSIAGATTALTNNGIIAPGDPLVNGGIGMLTIGSAAVNRTVAFGAGSAFNIQVGVGTGDRLAIFGSVDLSSTTDTLNITGTLDGTTNYVIVTNTGVRTGTFDTVTGLTGGYTVQYNANNITLLAAVPEPGTWVMLVMGLGALTFVYRRRLQA